MVCFMLFYISEVVGIPACLKLLFCGLTDIKEHF